MISGARKWFFNVGERFSSMGKWLVEAVFSRKTALFAQETRFFAFSRMRTVYYDCGDPEVYFDNPNLLWATPLISVPA